MPKPMDFHGKKVVVAGGAGLIGGAIAKAFAQQGAQVIVADLVRPSASGQSHRSMVREPFDITDLDGLAERVRELDRKYRGIDVWVNSAYPRTEDWNDPLEKISRENFRRNVEWQLNATCLCSNEIAFRMKPRRRGVIINLSSIYGVVAPDFSIYEGTGKTSPAAYSAIKGGVIAYSKYLASYFRNSGVRVNVVCPGGVYNRQSPRFLKQYARKTLVGRMARPEEIAWPVVFLASEEASYITGAVLMADGGWTTV